MGMGRHRDLPDFRDHTAETDAINKIIKAKGARLIIFLAKKQFLWQNETEQHMEG
jgi:hypothetical protein